MMLESVWESQMRDLPLSPRYAVWYQTLTVYPTENSKTAVQYSTRETRKQAFSQMGVFSIGEAGFSLQES